MKRSILTLLVLTFAAADVLAQDVAPRSARKPIDGIVAVVEDEAIFRSDIEQLIKQFMFQQGKSQLTALERQQLEVKVLQDLINDKLVIAQANRLDIEITFSEVEDQVTRAIEDNKSSLGGAEPFRQQLEREGFTEESLRKLYRDQLRNRLLVERVLQMEMARDGDMVSDEALRQYYEEKKKDIPQRPAVVNLKTIFIGFDTASNARESAKTKIDAIHERLMAGESFAELAKANSEDPTAPMGGDLGFVKPEDLREPAFQDAASNLGIGEVSDPVLTTYGYHILQVSERRPDTGEARVRHILIRIQPSDDDIGQVFDSANEVYQQLLAGGEFDSLANRYNTDPSTGPGGDLGWLKLDDLPPFFQEVLTDMNPGDVSQVLRESAGFRIVKMIDRENERPYDYEEVKSDLRALYQQEKMGQTYEVYVKGLRDKFSVEMVGNTD